MNQVLNEISNVLLKKHKIEISHIEKRLKTILNFVELYPLDDNNTLDALTLISQYNLSFYDALIVSAAMDADCTILFSEDMQDGLRIKDKLTIVNPFKACRLE